MADFIVAVKLFTMQICNTIADLHGKLVILHYFIKQFRNHIADLHGSLEF